MGSIRPNGTTARWLGLIGAIIFGVWGFASRSADTTVARVDTCETRLRAVEKDTTALRTMTEIRLQNIEDDVREIKTMLKEALAK